jgi:hypothetical protein
MSLASLAFEWLVILIFWVLNFRILVPKAEYTFYNFSWISPVIAPKMPGYLNIRCRCSRSRALQFVINILMAT